MLAEVVTRRYIDVVVRVVREWPSSCLTVTVSTTDRRLAVRHDRLLSSAVDFESEAYMLVVTLQVKDALDEAGYPDSDRVIEVWSEHRCS